MHRREWLVTDVKIVAAVVATARWLHRSPRPAEVARRYRDSDQYHVAGCTRTMRNHRPTIDLRAYVGTLPGMDSAMVGRLWHRWQGSRTLKLASYVEIRGQIAQIVRRIGLNTVGASSKKRSFQK